MDMSLPLKIEGITWRGPSIDDVELLPELASDLRSLLAEVNGFILHNGGLHLRGASLDPEWHSLRSAWRGPEAFHQLYEEVRLSDIPFAQDQFGDQFLMRGSEIIRLSAETGEIEKLATSLAAFLKAANQDLEGYLTVGLNHPLQPGELLFAWPPFCLKESGVTASLKPIPSSELIRFHADIARQIKDVPDGGSIELKWER